MKIKASGVIKSKDFAEKLVKLGCDRIAINIEEKDYFFNERAGIYRKQKNFNKSLSDYKICIEINNESSLYYNNIASLYKNICIYFDQSRERISNLMKKNHLI